VNENYETCKPPGPEYFIGTKRSNERQISSWFELSPIAYILSRTLEARELQAATLKQEPNLLTHPGDKAVTTEPAFLHEYIDCPVSANTIALSAQLH
jgi:hypothetical protein